jgi:hypothetical protein
MFNSQKIRPYIFAFLAFCVFSSKNIIIYNEETLVAASFLAFILFISHYFGNTIKDSLNERSDAITTELQNFCILKEQSLAELRKEHLKISTLNTPLTNLADFTGSELLIATSQGDKALTSIFAYQMIQKLKTLSASKITIQQKLQQYMAADFLGSVLVEFQRSKKENKYIPLNRESLEEAIKGLSLK